MMHTKKNTRSKLGGVVVVLALLFGTSLTFANGTEVTDLDEAFSLSEAQMQELLAEYYPVKLDIIKMFTEDIMIFDENDEIIYQGAFQPFEENRYLNDLVEQSDFLIYKGETSYYRLQKS